MKRPTRLLCVDDHAVLIEGLKAQFAIDGTLEIVGQLAGASQLVEEVDRLRPSAVLLDIEMPGADAFEMADRLHRAHPGVRVIILSAHVRDTLISAAFTAGASAYFAKSDELESIVNGIHEVMRSRPGSFLLGPKVRERCQPFAEAVDRHNPDDRRGATVGLSSDGKELLRTTAPPTLLTTLTPRESEILRLIGKGLSRTQIATQLSRSAKTIDGHQERMMRKLGITTRTDLMRFAIREGLAEA
jgi:DNA-binding NarL/FixJ family response regulator